MTPIDFNLLPALEALLTEGSVTGAARRLDLSASAMSRILARLRTATGDPLLVRAGHGMVPTPYAVALRDRVAGLSRATRAVLTPPAPALDLGTLTRTLTIRVSQGFMEALAAPLLLAVLAEAPGLTLRFAAKPDKDAGPIRDGVIDLEIGVRGTTAPEMRTRTLFRDRFVGVAKRGHAILDGAAVTPERYAACRHVVAARKAAFTGPVDDALEALGLRRHIAAVVPGYPDAIRMARLSDLVGLVPASCLTGEATEGVCGFALPVPTPPIAIAATWHPRMDADPVHRWLRGVVASCLAAHQPGQPCQVDPSPEERSDRG